MVYSPGIAVLFVVLPGICLKAQMIFPAKEQDVAGAGVVHSAIFRGKLSNGRKMNKVNSMHGCKVHVRDVRLDSHQGKEKVEYAIVHEYGGIPIGCCSIAGKKLSADTF